MVADRAAAMVAATAVAMMAVARVALADLAAPVVRTAVAPHRPAVQPAQVDQAALRELPERPDPAAETTAKTVRVVEEDVVADEDGVAEEVAAAMIRDHPKGALKVQLVQPAPPEYKPSLQR